MPDIDVFSVPGKNLPQEKVKSEAIIGPAQRVLNAFYDAVVACGRKPPFKPSIQVATSPGPTRYYHLSGAVVLIPYELLDPATRAAMDRFAAIGTLGLSGRAQYEEIFHNLLVAHELGHWLQMIAQQPLDRWQAEYGANQIMVAFWREHPAPNSRSSSRQLRRSSAELSESRSQRRRYECRRLFNKAVAEIERNPPRYAAFQKLMAHRAIVERPA